MNAILLAGGEIESGDPLYALAQGRLRAMLEVGGHPLIHWALQALDQARRISRIVVVGLSPETALECSKPLVLLPDQGSTRKNIQAGAEEVMRLDPLATHAILSTVDIPALTAEMVDWLVEQVQGEENDIDYTVIERTRMEAVFPQAHKTYMHLKDIDVCGGDLHCFRLGFGLQEHPLWDRLFEDNQNPLRQAALLGYDTVFILLLRRLDLKQAQARVSKRLVIQGRALLCPYPQVGLDASKPAHLEILDHYLSRGELAANPWKEGPLDE